MKEGEFIRQANGADWTVWRIDKAFDANSPYVFAVLVSNHKFHKAGTETRMLEKANYKVEPDPEAYARSHLFTVDLHVKAPQR